MTELLDHLRPAHAAALGIIAASILTIISLTLAERFLLNTSGCKPAGAYALTECR